ncbi:hypothetical protein K438DRAFT_1761527 [Mycena galopus ATCC 62051]|nr:hypothetical protein K438DRAFT_1761527 [Mycena galopus ATCC 62051]
MQIRDSADIQNNSGEIQHGNTSVFFATLFYSIVVLCMWRVAVKLLQFNFCQLTSTLRVDMAIRMRRERRSHHGFSLGFVDYSAEIHQFDYDYESTPASTPPRQALDSNDSVSLIHSRFEHSDRERNSPEDGFHVRAVEMILLALLIISCDLESCANFKEVLFSDISYFGLQVTRGLEAPGYIREANGRRGEHNSLGRPKASTSSHWATHETWPDDGGVNFSAGWPTRVDLGSLSCHSAGLKNYAEWRPGITGPK